MAMRNISAFTGSCMYLPLLTSITSGFTAALLFILGKRFYIHIEPSDTIITKCIPVIINAFQMWWKYKSDKNKMKKRLRNSSVTNVLFDSPHNREYEWSMHSEDIPSFLDYAKLSNNGKFLDRIVDDVKSLRRVIIVFFLLIPYWLIYYQVETI